MANKKELAFNLAKAAAQYRNLCNEYGAKENDTDGIDVSHLPGPVVVEIWLAQRRYLKARNEFNQVNLG